MPDEIFTTPNFFGFTVYDIMLLFYYILYKLADYITIYKTSTVLTNAMLMINTEATHTTLLDDAQPIK